MVDEKPRKKQRIVTSPLVDPDKPAARIVAKFGGLTRYCELTGFKLSTTASQMKRTGLIPLRPYGHTGMNTHEWIIECGRKAGIEITPADFIETKEAEAA